MLLLMSAICVQCSVLSRQAPEGVDNRYVFCSASSWVGMSQPRKVELSGLGALDSLTLWGQIVTK
jgi:hypothetical protein